MVEIRISRRRARLRRRGRERAVAIGATGAMLLAVGAAHWGLRPSAGDDATSWHDLLPELPAGAPVDPTVPTSDDAPQPPDGGRMRRDRPDDARTTGGPGPAAGAGELPVAPGRGDDHGPRPGADPVPAPQTPSDPPSGTPAPSSPSGPGSPAEPTPGLLARATDPVLDEVADHLPPLRPVRDLVHDTTTCLDDVLAAALLGQPSGCAAPG